MQHSSSFLELVEECRPLIKETDISTVFTRLKNKEKFILIDVREDNEWQQGHIPTAIHMSRGTIERDIEKYLPAKDSDIVLYCSGGFRSVLTAYNLQKMGYTNVTSMSGGLRNWLEAGYQLEA
ncbi:MAG: hypothetical protein QG673_554 [Pseudomonadota bacterium]|nr:hypothetical protein [Pseudomonadota bacterium]